MVSLQHGKYDIKRPEQVQVLFIHVPRQNCYYPALNLHNSCNRMALGLLALADYVHQQGYTTRVVHLGIEQRLDKKFSFADLLKKYRPKLIAFSQHFHHNLVDTLQSASLAKRILPDSFTLLGGFTSTFFAHDILLKAPFVDAVCKGDAEEPLRQLCIRLFEEQSTDISGLPNFVWRKNTEIQENEQSYTVQQDIFERLDFTNFSLLDHAEEYIKMPKAPVHTNIPGAFDKLFNSLTSRDKKQIYWGLAVGRGCPYTCCYCGGGAAAQKQINQRKGIIFKKPEQVVDSIRSLINFGFKGAYVSFDPSPKWSEAYYGELFCQIRQEGLPFTLLFSAWRLHTEQFLKDFAQTFSPDSSILISPETGSEERRQLSRSQSFSNAELLDRLHYADRLGVHTTVYFSIGALERSPAHLQATLDLKKTIKEQIRRVAVEGFLVEAEPGAPWHSKPEQYGIHLLRRTFDDFIRDHSAAQYSSMTHIGYTTPLFGSDLEPEAFYHQLLQFRCRHFCNSTTKCMIMRQVWQLARGLGLAPKPSPRSIEGLKYSDSASQ